MVATTDAMKGSELLYCGRAPKNIFELEAARVHIIQPEPLPVVFVCPPTDRERRRRARRTAAKESLHLERWEKFRYIISRRFSATAEATAMYHVIEFWECWLCGFDAYKSDVFQWWRCLHFDIRYRLIRISRKHGRDQLNRRYLLRKALSCSLRP